MSQAHVPEVSVVLGVRNCVHGLPFTMDALLAQEGVEFEVIAVDDGSDDGTLQALRGYANRDARVRVISEARRGLTEALITGCREARGEFVARQDAGPRTRPLPGRMRRQVEALRAAPDVVMVSCARRLLGPKGELLDETPPDPAEAAEGLHRLTLRSVRGVSAHGGVMFRRAAYERAGGYRSPFVVAQDLDLWLRLAEQGRHVVLPDVWIECGYEPEGTSGSRRGLQLRMTREILAAAIARRGGRDETPFLEAARRLSRRAARPPGRRARAAGWYFLGSMLGRRDARAARPYFLRALSLWPLHWRAFAKWVVLRGGGS